MHYYFEYGGGLGDVLLRAYTMSEYQILDDLNTEDTAEVVVSSVNPFADEVFKFAPWVKNGQVSVRLLPHWWPEEDKENRVKYQLPPYKPSNKPRTEPNPPAFYAPFPDFARIYEIDNVEDVIVIAPSAGGEWRIIPEPILNTIIYEVVQAGYIPVVVGREYTEQRGDRRWEYMTTNGVDMVNQLSVPGVIHLIRKSKAVICTHSAVNIMAWQEHVPQFLVAPTEVYTRCIYPYYNHTSEASYGLDHKQSTYSLFETFNTQSLIKWLENL